MCYLVRVKRYSFSAPGRYQVSLEADGEMIAQSILDIVEEES
jgi:hypothetical protein